MLLLALSLAAQAAPASAPKSPYQLTAEQVRQCGAIVANRDAHVAELATRDKDVLAEQAKLNARQAELQAKTTTVNTKKPKEVEAFNAESAEFNAAVPLHREKLAARNAYAAELSPIIDSYNRDCAHKSMNPADVAALPEAQRVVVAAGATTSTIIVSQPAPAASKRRRR